MVNIIGKPKTVQKIAENLGASYSVNQSRGIVMNMDDDKNRRLVEHCYRTTSTMINPILDWTDNDVWQFLKYYDCEANPLYQCGKSRVGCIGCPMQSNRKRIAEFDLYPKYKNLYIKTFDRMLQIHLYYTKNIIIIHGKPALMYLTGGRAMTAISCLSLITYNALTA